MKALVAEWGSEMGMLLGDGPGPLGWIKRSKFFGLLITAVLLVSLGTLKFPVESLLGSNTSYVKVVKGSEPGQIVVNLGGGTELAKKGNSSSGSSRTVAIKPPSQPISLGKANQVVAPNPCVLDAGTQRDPFGSNVIGLASAEVVKRYLINIFGVCKSGRGKATNLPTPSEVANSEWSMQLIKQLPTPSPAIPPGYGVVGITSYLLSGDSIHASLSAESVLGELAISATSTYSVSFDGGDQYFGPYQITGEPFPVGGIDHMWLNPGPHSIIVLQNWTGTWYLDGQSGSLPTLQTKGEVANFLVTGFIALRTS